MLHCRLADGRALEIRRSFGRDENRIEIRTSTGEDITRQYDQQRNGEVLFARTHFGIPKELYESVGIIRENMASEIHSRETIRDRIANLAHSGDEELSIRRSMSRLEEVLDSVGSERAPTKPFRQAMNLVRDLQSEQKALEERRVQFQEWLEERNRLAVEVRQLDSEHSRIRIALRQARRRDMVSKIESMEEMEGNISRLNGEIESLGAREDFPVESLDDLNRLVGARDSVARRLKEVRAEKETALSRLAQAESERGGLVDYAPLSESVESEKVTEWFVSYLSLSLQKDGLKKTSDRLKSDAADLEKRLGKLCPALADPESDWQSFAREAAEDEQSASRKCSVLAEQATQEKSKMALAVRTTFNRRFFAVVLLLAASVPFGLRFWAGFGSLPEWFDYAFGALCLALSVLMWVVAAKSAGEGLGAQAKIRDLELEQEKIRAEGEVKRKQLDGVIETSGRRDLDDFLAAAKKSEQDRRKLEDISSRLEETELQIQNHQRQSEETFRLLKESLAKAGLSCSPGNLKYQVDLLRTNLRRFRELDENYRRCRQEVDSLRTKETSLDGEHVEKCESIQILLAQAGVETPEEFRGECRKRQKSIELLEKRESRSREFKRLAEGRTLEQWKEALQEIESQKEGPVSEEVSIEEDRKTDTGSDMPRLPYLPTITELEEKERDVASRLSDARQGHARSVERVHGAFQNYRLLSEIDEDLSLAETQFRELERNRAALNIALETIEKLSRQQQEVLAPQLNAAVVQRFIRLSGRRYEEVKIDPDFQVWVRESDTGELRSADQLSRGTQDQLYFAIRFGILDLVSDGDESCPCLLDEPFAAYDKPRLLEAFKILSEESARRQLILFTCREDLLDIARQQEANIIRLNPEE